MGDTEKYFCDFVFCVSKVWITYFYSLIFTLNKFWVISDIKSNDAIGVISVAKEEGKNINEIYNMYIIGDGERTKTELSDNLIFVEIINKVESVVHGERIDKMYCFIFYEENTHE